ncbi:DNA methyltransferase [Vibrio sp. OPT18]|uniref:DNA methyltransferase n=1 Tax=Vibrio sp. OPT18 TaxID=2778641 RepID=UPI00187E57A2|nr:site-specific DNA-methyltransferase [Vibrio sp. OPT18]MBE8577872.1 site-specific DNA-methyltransferase [Vibrio sp. OPT18]
MLPILNALTNALQADDRLVIDGKLAKNKIVELALNLDPALLKLLLADEQLKKHFFQDVDGMLIFDKVAFQRFVNNKSFLPDSYTQFKNKIGLASDTHYLSESNDIVLAWPYKDCVLEGGQTKEDQKRNEIFWNETLAPEQVDTLLAPKALTNFKKFDSDGEHVNFDFNDDDNLLIKGNNLLALSCLKRYEKKVNLICIDPPYNTNGDGFKYNDSFSHSTWLTFMKNRLLVSKGLLKELGTIFIFCDENEQAYLKVLADEIYGRDCFITTVIWRHSDNSNNDAKKFSTDHNYILVYSNNPSWESYKLTRTEEQASHYKNPNNDPRGPWFDGNPLNSPNPRKNLTYDIVAPNGNIINPPTNGWRWDKTTLQQKMESGEIYFNVDNTNIKRRTYLYEQKGLPPSTLWSLKDESYWAQLEETGHTRQAKSEQKKLFPTYKTSELFSTPKPERVIKKILDISTQEGDLVLDFFAGSGTTAAVAIKMNRQVICIEQMDYISEFTIERLKKVISGEQSGISKELSWQGGSSFIYCELAEQASTFLAKIESADTVEKVLAVWTELKESSNLSFKVDPILFDDKIESFKALPLEEQKQLLIEMIDKNQLYVNLSDIQDESNNISAKDIEMNNQFYGA